MMTTETEAQCETICHQHQNQTQCILQRGTIHKTYKAHFSYGLLSILHLTVI